MTADDWILAEKSNRHILFSTVVWSYEKTSLCEELFWRWNMRFLCCSVLQEDFVKEFE